LTILIKKTFKTLYYSHFQTSVYSNIDEMCNELFENIDMNRVSELVHYVDNLRFQRETIISFKYDERICELGEHYDRQIDYFWVRMLPI